MAAVFGQEKGERVRNEDTGRTGIILANVGESINVEWQVDAKNPMWNLSKHSKKAFQEAVGQSPAKWVFNPAQDDLKKPLPPYDAYM